MSDLQWSTDKPEHDMHSCLTCRKKYNAKDALLRELVEDFKKALESMDRHDNASYQCESVEGAEGASDARKYIEDGLRRAQAAMKVTK